jgi:endonuclease/exonuclease/phosphatase family metal-dependent hydrolase
MFRKRTLPYIIFVASALFMLLGWYATRPSTDGGNINDVPEAPDDEPAPEEPSTIKVAAFNIQIFGRTKREKEDVMTILVNITRQFDLVLIQEIRDSSETTAPLFLEMINEADGPDYAYVRSPRLGRTSSKEAYAYFYNTETVNHSEGSDHVYNDTDDVFEREPYIASFSSGGFDFTLIGIHTKPDDAHQEIGNLTVVVASVIAEDPEEADVIILGDLNADGSYFDEDGTSNPLQESGYHWTVTNEMDTMTKTDWTYDRIILLDATYSYEYLDSSAQVYYFDLELGIEDEELIWDVSDHYPVYAEFSTTLQDDD